MEEKKTIKISLDTVVCILIIIVLLVLLGIMYVHYNSKETTNANQQVNNNIVETNDIEITELDIDSELVTELYSKILKSNYIYDYWSEEQYSFYTDGKIILSNLSNLEKIITVLQYLEEGNYGTKIEFLNLEQETIDNLEFYISGQEDEGDSYSYCIEYDNEDLEIATKSIFGNDVEVDWISFNNNCGGAFDYINGKYYSYSYMGGGYGVVSNGYSKIEKATQEDDYIYIYDKFIYGVDEPESCIKYYTNSTKKDFLGEEEFGEKYDLDTNADATSVSELISKYEDKLNTYKHTFKKDTAGNYYWISTEIAQ